MHVRFFMKARPKSLKIVSKIHGANPFFREVGVADTSSFTLTCTVCTSAESQDQYSITYKHCVPEPPVPKPPVQSTMTGLIKCSRINISGDTGHLPTWRPTYNSDLILVQPLQNYTRLIWFLQTFYFENTECNFDHFRFVSELLPCASLSHYWR